MRLKDKESSLSRKFCKRNPNIAPQYASIKKHVVNANGFTRTCLSVHMVEVGEREGEDEGEGEGKADVVEGEGEADAVQVKDT